MVRCLRFSASHIQEQTGYTVLYNNRAHGQQLTSRFNSCRCFFINNSQFISFLFLNGHSQSYSCMLVRLGLNSLTFLTVIMSCVVNGFVSSIHYSLFLKIGNMRSSVLLLLEFQMISELVFCILSVHRDVVRDCWPFPHLTVPSLCTRKPNNQTQCWKNYMETLLYMKTDRKTLLLCCLRHVSLVKILIVDPKFIKNSSTRCFDS